MMKLESSAALANASPATPEDRDVKTREDVKNVAKEFESLIALELLKTMRKTIQKSSGGGFDSEMATSMYDEELAKSISSGGAFGIADMMEASLAERMGLSEDGREAGAPMAAPMRHAAMNAGGLSTHAVMSLNDGSWVQPVADAPIRFSEGQRFGAHRDDHKHAGLDLAEPVGTPVRSANGGTIAAIRRDPNSRGGLQVTVDHPGGFTTKYMHLDSINPQLAVGAPVSAGASLGTVGNTGTSSHGAHLHFELEHQGAKVDPEPFVRSWR